MPGCDWLLPGFLKFILPTIDCMHACVYVYVYPRPQGYYTTNQWCDVILYGLNMIG